MPVSWLRFLLLAGALTFLVTLVQFEVISAAFERLGLSHQEAYTLLVGTLLGSLVNVPLFRMRATPPASGVPDRSLWTPFRMPQPPFTGRTVIAINAGGCLIPVLFSTHLVIRGSLGAAEMLVAVAIVASIAYAFSRPVSGAGVALPIFVAPFTAALVATVLDYEQRAPLAYISGTLGVLLGADVLRLRDIRSMGAPMASIGGAGTFDGIFLAGLLAVLLT
jgi:uncharacterized membrane protein